jgi:hypothetical protein
MLLEGLAQFHQHSIWLFETSSKVDSSEYTFPLITPSLVREQHLIIAPLKSDPYKVFEKRRTETKRIFSLRSDTMALVNTMTTSTEEYDAVRKVKIEMTLLLSDFTIGRHSVRCFDLSGLDRLAVHRRLESFEVVYRSAPLRYRAAAELRLGTQLRVSLDNLAVELDTVGGMLILEGLSALPKLEASWVRDLQTIVFKYRRTKV